MRRWFVLLYFFAAEKTGMQDGGYVPGTCADAGAARNRARIIVLLGLSNRTGTGQGKRVCDLEFDAPPLRPLFFSFYFASSTLSLSVGL